MGMTCSVAVTAPRSIPNVWWSLVGLLFIGSIFEGRHRSIVGENGSSASRAVTICTVGFGLPNITRRWLASWQNFALIEGSGCFHKLHSNHYVVQQENHTISLYQGELQIFDIHSQSAL